MKPATLLTSLLIVGGFAISLLNLVLGLEATVSLYSCLAIHYKHIL